MDREDGFTVVETIVGVFLIAIAMAVALVIFIQATGTSERYVETTSNQADLTNAITKITHSLSTSTTLTEATEQSIEFKDSTGETVRYMYFQPNNPAHKKYMTNFTTVTGETYNYAKKPRALPSSKGEVYLVEIRTINGKANFTVLVSGVSMDQDKTGMSLFTYYDKSNAIMKPPVGKSDLLRVTRVGLRIVSATTTRADTNSMELGTSISFTGSRFGTEVRPGSTKPHLTAPGRPVLQGILPRPGQKATLSWPLVAGADAYILYRDGNQIATLGESATSYVDNNRPWGGDQTYHIVAAGPGGLSPESNSVLLRVVPETPAFTNVNPEAPGAGSTVARDLTNHLSWTPRSGATGYKLFRGKELIYKGSDTSFADAGRNYGDVTSYTVIAYNDIVNNSGGDSPGQDEVSLISPPPAPVLTLSHKNGIRDASWNAPTNATKYELERTAPNATVIYRGANRSASDSSSIDAATFTYRVRAGNDAGWSPWTSASINPRPGNVTLTGYDHDDGVKGDRREGNTNNNTLLRSDAANATYYLIDGGRFGTNFRWETTSGREIKDLTAAFGSTTSYTVRACNITGCSNPKKETLLQGPAKFSLQSVEQTKRTGFRDPDADKGPRNWGSMPLTSQRLTMKWHTPAGAGHYKLLYENGNTAYGLDKLSTPAFGTTNVVPGEEYRFKIRAVAPNGVTTDSSVTKVQMAPAKPHNLTYRPQSTDGYLSRAQYWAVKDPGQTNSYVPVTGKADRLEYQLFTVRSINGNANYRYGAPNGGSGAGWLTWNGTKYSSTYSKHDAGNGSSVGSVMFTRSVKSVPPGTWSGTTFTRDSTPGDLPGNSSQAEFNIPHANNGDADKSAVLYIRALTGLKNPWSGSYSGSWKNVVYANDNYPSSYDNMNQIKSR